MPISTRAVWSPPPTLRRSRTGSGVRSVGRCGSITVGIEHLLPIVYRLRRRPGLSTDCARAHSVDKSAPLADEERDRDGAPGRAALFPGAAVFPGELGVARGHRLDAPDLHAAGARA